MAAAAADGDLTTEQRLATLKLGDEIEEAVKVLTPP
jgi:hypothetical protein